MDSNSDLRVGCGLCGEKVAPSYLYRHHARHHAENPKKFSCLSCPKQYFTKARLDDHTKTRHHRIQSNTISLGSEETDNPEPPVVVFCDLCGKTFVSEERMLAHKAYMHPIKIVSLPCPKCEKVFETQLAFKKHTTALHRNLACNECSKKLGSSRSLKDHQKRKHSNSNWMITCICLCLTALFQWFSHMTLIFE